MGENTASGRPNRGPFALQADNGVDFGARQHGSPDFERAALLVDPVAQFLDLVKGLQK
jgi:hypothetical protein